jgi:hypothetical protein
MKDHAGRLQRRPDRICHRQYVNMCQCVSCVNRVNYMRDPHRDDSPPDDSLLLGLVHAHAANRDAFDEVDPGATDELPAGSGNQHD